VSRRKVQAIVIAALLPMAFPQPPLPGRSAALIGPASAIHVTAGQQAKFSAYIKTVDVTGGAASLWWQKVDRGVQVLDLNSGPTVQVSGTTEWQRYEIAVPAFAEEGDMRFGVSLSGNGTAWYNTFSIEIDGTPVKDSHVLDPGGWTRPRGFTNNGYDIGVVRRWLRSSADDAAAARDNGPTLIIKSISRD
jgi:hypothetical protein